MQALLNGKLGETSKSALMRAEGLRWNGVTNGYRAFAAAAFEGSHRETTSLCDRVTPSPWNRTR